MKYSLKTDRGRQRTQNEDACFAGSPSDETCFAVVCDGMGGANAGEVASLIAVNTVSERVMAGWRKNISSDSVENLLTSAISAANICVLDEAEEDILKRGMGTTIVAAAVTPEYCVVAHAGDSRAYLLRNVLSLVTHDHSYVQMLVDSGLITPEEASDHPQKNYITRALGIGEHIEIDFSVFGVQKGDKLLLCSDGLTNYVPDEDIFRIMSENDADTAAERLIEAANANGGGDNITAVVISV